MIIVIFHLIHTHYSIVVSTINQQTILFNSFHYCPVCILQEWLISFSLYNELNINKLYYCITRYMKLDDFSWSSIWLHSITNNNIIWLINSYNTQIRIIMFIVSIYPWFTLLISLFFTIYIVYMIHFHSLHVHIMLFSSYQFIIQWIDSYTHWPSVYFILFHCITRSIDVHYTFNRSSPMQHVHSEMSLSFFPLSTHRW